jgi:hypothetical protein
MNLLGMKRKLLPLGSPQSGGGSGGGGPTQTTSYTTNIPEYARPYVENMLQSTQSQIYNEDMTGFRPYQPYSTDVNNYFAGFSPLQQSAQQAAYYMQTPGQFDIGTGLAGAAGVGGLGAADQSGYLGSQALGYGATGAEYGGIGAQQALATAQQTGRQAGRYGRMGAGYGARGVEAAEQGFGAGEAFARQATDPYATQAYMSPYMQNVVDYQKSQALRDFNIGRGMRGAQAVGKGAFGGSRQAIVEAEAERSLGSQLQSIAAQGSQKAFEDAQRQQQFGANLGLQGLQAGYGGLGLGMQGAGLGLQGVGAQQAAGQLGLAGTAQGIQGAGMGLQGVQGALGAGQYGLQGYGMANQAAGTLGQLGGAQFGTQKDIIGLQSQMGAQQQQLEQQKINQAIQDYAIAQQYPFMQLGMMNAMLRGLPLQTQTTQLYQAQPSTMQQGIGLLGAGASLFGGRREGGAIKEYREGGIASVPGYKYGKLISEPKLESMADDLTIPQLQQRLKDPALTPGERQIFAEALQEKMQQEKGRMSGIAMAGGPAFEQQGMAGGGIIAFAGEGPSLVEDPQFGGGVPITNTVRPMSVEELFKEYPGLEGKVGLAQIKDYTSGRVIPPESAKAKPAPVAAPAAAAAPKPEVKPLVAKEGADTEGRNDRSGVITGARNLQTFFDEQKKLGPKGELGADFEKFLSEYVGDSDRLSRKERMAMAKGFLKFASTPAPGGIMQAAAAGLGEYATGVEAAKDAEDKIKFETAKIKGDLDKARRAEARGDVDAAQKAYDSAANRENQIKVAQMQLSRGSEFERQYAAFKDNPAAFEKFRKSLTSQDDTARLNAYVKADEFISKAYPNLMFSKKPEDMQKLEQLRNAKVAEYLGAVGMAAQSAPAAPQAGPDGTINIPGKGTFKQLPNGNYVKV